MKHRSLNLFVTIGFSSYGYLGDAFFSMFFPDFRSDKLLATVPKWHLWGLPALLS